MNNNVKFKLRASLWSMVGLSCFVLFGCQKEPTSTTVVEESVSASAATATASKEMPTGLVKNPVKHSDTMSDISRWLDMASKKSAAQIAREEQEARDAKEAKQKESVKLAEKAAQEKLRPTKSLPVQTHSATPEVIASTKSVSTPAQSSPPVVATVASVPHAISSPSQPTSNTAQIVDNAVLKLISKVDPRFPPLAIRNGVSGGNVTARINVAPDGHVSSVEIVKAQPARQFEKEVVHAASQWKYAPMAKAQSTLVEFSFKLEN